MIKLEVFDFDGPRSSDDLIGMVKTNLVQLLEKGKEQTGFTLENNVYKKMKEFGELVILVCREEWTKYFGLPGWS